MYKNKSNNIPLPTLSLRDKSIYSAIILISLVIYLSTWIFVISSIYWRESSFLVDEFLGVRLGMLAIEDSQQFFWIFTIHTLSLFLIVGATFRLFKKTSIRRKAKTLIFWIASLLVLLDLYAWWQAPTCSSTNIYVGVLGILSSLPLILLAIAPLYQMWIYKRWQNKDGKKKSIVIIGGGFAGLYAAMGLNKKLGYHPDIEITLIDRKNYFLFPPLLPSAAAGTIETRQVSYPFRRIFETTNIRFKKATVNSINPSSNTVFTTVETEHDPSEGSVTQRTAEYKYDYLILAPGSITQTFNIAGVKEHAFFMRELNDAVVLRNHVIDCFERAAILNNSTDQSELLRFVIVGAGPTGIETATEIYDLIHHVLLKRYPEIDPSLPDVSIIHSGDQILPGWHSDIVNISLNKLRKMNINLYFNSRVNEVSKNQVRFGEHQLSTRTVIWCAGVKPSPLLERSGLNLDKSGRVAVSDDLRANNNVFVLGDAAYLRDKKSGQVLPPLGQVAFQQGSHTAKNIIRLLQNSETKEFKYFNYGGLVSVGEHFAAVNLMGIRISGFMGWLVWRSLYLTKLVGVSNKIRVVIDWTLDLLIERSISQIRDKEASLS